MGQTNWKLQRCYDRLRFKYQQGHCRERNVVHFSCLLTTKIRTSEDDDIEAIWIAIALPSITLIILCHGCRPERPSVRGWPEKTQASLQWVLAENKEVIIVDDVILIGSTLIKTNASPGKDSHWLAFRTDDCTIHKSQWDSQCSHKS